MNGPRSANLVAAALAALALAGCADGNIRSIDYKRDLPPETMKLLDATPWHHVYVENTHALPMFYLHHGRLYVEEGVRGWRAEWRAIYVSGVLAQRYYDANFDPRGRNLSYRIIEMWLFGLAWKWDAIRWHDPGGRVREYLDATVLFGAFGYTRDGDDHDIVLLWIPIPLP